MRWRHASPRFATAPLRRQVTQYVPYTARHALVEEFTPEQSEDQLYHLVSDYLGRENLFALPPAQRTLMTLVLRKLLASSTFAIAGALQTMARRLGRDLAQQEMLSLEDELDEDYESLDETAEEWPDDDTLPRAVRLALRLTLCGGCTRPDRGLSHPCRPHRFRGGTR